MIQNSRKKVAIIGGGFSGLTLAYLLSKNNVAVTLFEKNRLGGMISSVRTNNGIVESAANGLILTDTIEELLKELDLKFIGTSKTAKKRWFFHKNLQKWPLSLWQSLKAGLMFLMNYLRKDLEPKDGESIENWGIRIFGKDFSLKILSVGIQGIYAGDAKRLSAKKILGRFFSKKKRYKYRGTVSFKYGMQELINALRDRCLANGVLIKLEEAHFDSLSKNFSTIVIATSAAEASHVLKNSSMSDYKVLGLELAKIEMLSVLSCNVKFFDFPENKSGFGVLTAPSSGLSTLGVLYNHFIFPDQENPKYAETWIMGGSRDSSLVTKNDDDLKSLISVEREKMFGRKSACEQIYVTKWPSGLPYYTESLRKIIEEIKLPKGVFLHGNYIKSIGLSQIFENSLELASKIAEHDVKKERSL